MKPQTPTGGLLFFFGAFAVAFGLLLYFVIYPTASYVSQQVTGRSEPGLVRGVPSGDWLNTVQTWIYEHPSLVRFGVLALFSALAFWILAIMLTAALRHYGFLPDEPTMVWDDHQRRWRKG